MSYFEIILLAIIQGITEWLPVSSSGHLVLAQELFKMNVPLYYDILLHFATVIVIFLVFYREIFNILKAFSKFDFKDEYGKMGLYILIGTMPIAFVGYFFNDFILSLFTDVKVVGIGLLITAILLFASKHFQKKKKLSVGSSIIIGISQALAIIPGISRSGSTISTGLLLGIKKEHITSFSFLLAVPAILGATILEFERGIITTEMIVGILVTILIGYITLRILIQVIKKNKFHYFGYYCLILSIIILLL